jgi:hypothetical protein
MLYGISNVAKGGERMLIHEAIKIVKILKNGVKVSKVGVDLVKKELVSGTIKLDDQETVSIVCKYKDGGETKTLEATNKHGVSNDTVTINEDAKTGVHIDYKPVGHVPPQLKAIVAYHEGDVKHEVWIYADLVNVKDII